MTANSTGSFFTSLFSCICLLLFACETESVVPSKLTFVPTQLTTYDQQLISLGTAYNKSSIQYPALQIHNEEPIIFASETSARGILIKKDQFGQPFISYYQAKSLGQQEEVSRLFSLNSEHGLDPIISYGHRTRVVDFIPSSSQQFISLNYERQTANSSVAWIKNKEVKNKEMYTIGEETTIPKQIKQLENGDLLISGIADGFEFKDGHSYKEAFTKGFILLTDNEGVEKERWLKAENNGHVFFEEMQVNDDHIYISGSMQQGDTGLDVFIIKLDKQLNQINEVIFTESHHQEIIEMELREESILLFMTSVNDRDKQHLLIKELSYQELELRKHKIDSLKGSAIKDVITFENNTYVLLHDQKRRVDIPLTSILKIDLPASNK